MQWSQTPVRRVASDLAMKANKVPKPLLPHTQLCNLITFAAVLV